MAHITRELLNASTGTIAGATVVYSNVLEANSGVRIGNEIEADASCELFDETFTIRGLFASVVGAGEEVYLTGPNGEDFCVAEFELFIIAVTGNGKGLYNCDYRVFALNPIEEDF